jgi:hypothetical protein
MVFINHVDFSLSSVWNLEVPASADDSSLVVSAIEVIRFYSCHLIDGMTLIFNPEFIENTLSLLLI